MTHVTLEQKNAMQSAIDEINSLRRRNEILEAKVETMHLLAGFLHAKLPENSIGASIDVAWQLEKELQNITKRELLEERNRIDQSVKEARPE